MEGSAPVSLGRRARVLARAGGGFCCGVLLAEEAGDGDGGDAHAAAEPDQWEFLAVVEDEPVTDPSPVESGPGAAELVGDLLDRERPSHQAAGRTRGKRMRTSVCSVSASFTLWCRRGSIWPCSHRQTVGIRTATSAATCSNVRP